VSVQLSLWLYPWPLKIISTLRSAIDWTRRHSIIDRIDHGLPDIEAGIPANATSYPCLHHRLCPNNYCSCEYPFLISYQVRFNFMYFLATGYCISFPTLLQPLTYSKIWGMASLFSKYSQLDSVKSLTVVADLHTIPLLWHFQLQLFIQHDIYLSLLQNAGRRIISWKDSRFCLHVHIWLLYNSCILYKILNLLFWRK